MKKTIKNFFISLMILVLFLSSTLNVYASSADTITSMDQNEITVVFNGSDSQTSTFEVFQGGVLDYTVEVNLDEDLVIEYFNDGTECVHQIGDLISIEKLPDNPVPTVETSSNPIALYADYVGNEPFNISSTGAQLSLGTSVYDGYEVLGFRTYVNPVESGYLQRKASGYTTFDSYKFNITAGTALGTAVSTIVSLFGAATGTSIATSIVSSLISGLVGAGVGVLVDGLDGTLRCREYRWNYRVRHNSNTGNILKTTYKCRYWWEMYDKKGNRSFEFRNDLRDGWLLSNDELISTALGR